MIQAITVTHIDKNDHADPDLTHLPSWCSVWQTCMRTIIFGDFNIEEFPTLKNFERHKDEMAFRFLLEIICGLRSKLIGETEVISQFKKFNSDYPHAISKNLSDKLLQDSKIIRRKFINGGGERSYGSYIQKHAKKADKLHVLGCGHLAQVILPMLKKEKDVSVYTRSPHKYSQLHDKYENYQWSSLQQFNINPHKSQIVVIAAPLETSWLNQALENLPKGSHVIDLRSKSEGPILRLSNHIKVDHLEGVMKHISSNQKRIISIVPDIKTEIARLANLREQKPILRPMGWEDVCI